MLALVILPSCTGLERRVTIAPEDEVVVELFQPPGGRDRAVTREIRQTLASESMYDRVEFYSARESDPLTKILETEKIQLLLDAYATAGFYDHAASRQLTAGTTTLSVAVNGDRLVFPRVVRLDDQGKIVNAAELEAFQTCWTVFIEVFNATPAYRTSRGADSVIREHQAQRQARGASR